MLFIPSFKKIRCCFCLMLIIGLASVVMIKLGPGMWTRFYTIENFNQHFPTLGSLVDFTQFKITVQRIDRYPNPNNPQSDFETLFVEMTVQSKLPVNKLIFDLCELWVEDDYGNKAELSTTDRRNSILENSEVTSTGTLQIQTYFSVSKFSKQLYLMIKPKIGGQPIKIQL